jgi:hypothetical protein
MVTRIAASCIDAPSATGSPTRMVVTGVSGWIGSAVAPNCRRRATRWSPSPRSDGWAWKILRAPITRSSPSVFTCGSRVGSEVIVVTGRRWWRSSDEAAGRS